MSANWQERRWEGDKEREGRCNMLTVNLIDYNDSGMAEGTMDIECFLRAIRRVSQGGQYHRRAPLPRSSALSKRNKQIRCMSASRADLMQPVPFLHLESVAFCSFFTLQCLLETVKHKCSLCFVSNM